MSQDKRLSVDDAGISIQASPEMRALIQAVQGELHTRMENARLAMAQEKLQMHHNIGRMIKTHLLENKDRADYGKTVIELLSKEIEMSSSELYRSVQFYEAFDTILATWRELSWSHVKLVLTLDSASERRKIIKEIISKKISVKELRETLTPRIELSEVPPKRIMPGLTAADKKPGRRYIYRLETDEATGKVMIDLGFGIATESPDQTLRVDSIYLSHKDAAQYTFSYTQTHKSPHYTYKAIVKDIIDGDTLRVKINLGFGNTYTQKIRLKGIDTPELNTADGQAARRFVVQQLKGCDFVIIKTFWRDKFKRYLADVYYMKGAKTSETVIKEGLFLNAEIPVYFGDAQKVENR